MVILHSFFDLQDHCTAEQFSEAINALATHLVEKNLLLSHQFMERQAHDGYNADAPDSHFYHAMKFDDLQQAIQCWSYIEEDSEPIRTLHGRIKTSVTNTSFSLYRDYSKE